MLKGQFGDLISHGQMIRILFGFGRLAVLSSNDSPQPRGGLSPSGATRCARRSDTPPQISNLRLPAAGKSTAALNCNLFARRGRPRLRIEGHMACAHETALVRSICAQKWPPQEGYRMFFSWRLDVGLNAALGRWAAE